MLYVEILLKYIRFITNKISFFVLSNELIFVKFKKQKINLKRKLI
jgi:hypothetical protein